MSPVLLKINAFWVDYGDRFPRVSENLPIEIGAQFYGSRSRLSMSFCGRHSTFCKGETSGVRRFYHISGV
jgi:hypothetical protein